MGIAETRALSVLLLGFVALVAASWSSGQSLSQPDPKLDPNIRNIQTITVKWKRTTNIAQAQPPTADELQHLTQAAGLELAAFKDHGYGYIVFQLPRLMSWIEAEHIAASIRALPEVEFADPNGWAREHAVPSDPLFEPRQWNLKLGFGGINAEISRPFP